MKRVAVVIPTRNMAATLGRAINAAAGADEIHVVDDASTDDTASVAGNASVYYWRWPKKSRCWLSALRHVYHAIDCDHVVFGSADDVLMPGLIPAVREHADAAVVFSDYDVVTDAGVHLWTISQDVRAATAFTAEEMRLRVQGTRCATETGIGASVRRDVAEWLWDTGWECMGRHADSVGYTTAACLYGCVMLPIVGAAYTFTEVSYGRPQSLSQKDMARAGLTCRGWMSHVGLDDASTRAIAMKRCSISWE